MPNNDFTRKNNDFDTFTKIAEECRRFRQINCGLRLWKVPQSLINCPIWSHCLWTTSNHHMFISFRALSHLRRRSESRDWNPDPPWGIRSLRRNIVSPFFLIIFLNAFCFTFYCVISGEERNITKKFYSRVTTNLVLI